eukprot:2466457-Pyramimonas_sp.AAC.1
MYMIGPRHTALPAQPLSYWGVLLLVPCPVGSFVSMAVTATKVEDDDGTLFGAQCHPGASDGHRCG